MRKVRSVEVPVGYMLIKTSTYTDMVSRIATADAQDELTEMQESRNKYRDRAWAAEAERDKLKKQIGGDTDGSKED